MAADTYAPSEGPCDRRYLSRRIMLGLAGGVLAVAGSGVGNSPHASASCAAPSFDIEYSERHPYVMNEDATGLTIEGRDFVNGCDDEPDAHEGSGLGCSPAEDSETDTPAETPMEDVQLRLRQDGNEWVLGTSDAGSTNDNELGHISWTFDVPADVEPGPAVLMADTSERVPVEIR